MRIPACLGLCVVLAACGSSAGSSAPARPSPLVRLERGVERRYGVSNPECRAVHAGDPSRFACFVDSKGVVVRLAVRQPGAGAAPVVTTCKVVRQNSHAFGTCSVGPG